MTPDEYRRLALLLPEATEGAHMSHPDFRVRGKIFATLWPDKNYGVVMLTPDQQETLVAAEPSLFEPVPGGWGRRGSTILHLPTADEATANSALLMAWRNKAPRNLVAAD
jgi:hypothetical protein